MQIEVILYSNEFGELAKSPLEQRSFFTGIDVIYRKGNKTMVYFVGAGPGAKRSYHGTWNASVRTGGCGDLRGFACESGTFILLQKRV